MITRSETKVAVIAQFTAFEAHLAAPYTVDLLGNIIPRLTQAQLITTHKEVLVPV